MAAFTNLNFETAGAGPGEADGWTLEVVATAVSYADYGTDGATETFEDGWSNTPQITTIPDADLEFAAYSSPPLIIGEPFESFERGETYLTEIGTKENASYGIGSTAQDVETFNEQWAEVSQTFTADAGTDRLTTSAAHKLTSGRMVRFETTGTLPGGLTSTDPFYVRSIISATEITLSATPSGPLLDITSAGTGVHTIFAGTQSAALTTIPGSQIEWATYDAGGSANDHESFEMADGWDAAYGTTIASSTFAQYYSVPGGGLQAFEDFESIMLRQQFTVTPATNTIHATAHGFSDGDVVRFASDGRLPGGLIPLATFYVRASTASAFEVEIVQGSGTAVDITDTGIGVSRLVADEAEWFTIDLGPL